MYVFIHAGIHAREWISPAVTTYAINELTSKSEEYAKLLENLDWYILPSHNPDGYNFTMEHVVESKLFFGQPFWQSFNSLSGQTLAKDEVRQWIDIWLQRHRC